MTPERWQKINEIFQSVVGLEPDKKEQYLNKACADDESLRQQVETLLAADNEAGNFIGGNAAKDVGHLLTDDQHKTLTGDSLGHYEVLSVLGSGGMGKVYLAQDSKLNRPIAVKTLPDTYAPDSDYVKRFRTEAKAAANLNHPNVATVYSVEETDDNQHFITMEYVDGDSLGKLIPENGIDTRTFLDWFVAIADALFHAHEKGIVHRDIKPNNIMIAAGGVPKILDFGLARIDQNEGSTTDASTLNLTKTGQVMGTPAYMSPEQAEGKPADHRSDIFSLGVVMYEAITGQKPFNGESYASFVSELLTKEPQPVSNRKPEAPYLLSRLIMKCLNKDPRYRYQSMNEVRLILQEVRSAIDSGVSLSQPIERVDVGRSTWSPFVAFGFLGLLGLLGLLVGWNWFGSKNNAADEVVRFGVTPQSNLRLNVMNTRISPDGKMLVLPTFLSDGPKFYVRSLSSFETKPVRGTEGGTTAFFSPDGKWIAFATKSEGIKKVPANGGNPIVICEACPTNRGGHWGTDGNIYIGSPKGIISVPSDGGTPKLLTKIDKENQENQHYSPQLFPNEKGLIFTVSRKGSNRLGLFSVSDNTTKYIDEADRATLGSYVSTGHIVFARGNQLMALPFDEDSFKAVGKPVLVVPDLFGMFPNVQIADNGTLLYLPVISRTNNQVVWVGRDGKETPAIEKKGDFSSPRVSPDGRWIAVTYDDDIWVYSVESNIGTRITDEGKNEIPLWSNDGQWVIYSTLKDDTYTVYRRRRDGTGAAEKLAENPHRISPYSLHPTEDVLALTKEDGQENLDIVTKPLKGDSYKKIAATKFREDTLRFSPDGKFFAYFSMDTGSPQIYAQPWNGEGSKVPITKDGGMFPVWAKSGKEIFYRHSKKFYSVSVNTSGGFQSSPPKLLFEGKYLTSFDISPDGTKFLMVKDEHGTLPKKLNVVLNWTDELKQIMSSSK